MTNIKDVTCLSPSVRKELRQRGFSKVEEWVGHRFQWVVPAGTAVVFYHEDGSFSEGFAVAPDDCTAFFFSKTEVKQATSL